MIRSYGDNDDWTLQIIGVKLIAYPLGIMFTFHGFLSIFDAESTEDLIIRILLTSFSTILISIFLYFDIKAFLGRNKESENIGNEDVLDDIFIN